MKILIITNAFLFFSYSGFAGDWIQIQNDKADIKLVETEIENNLWIYLNGQKGYDFHPRELYTYQCKIQSGQILHINAYCEKGYVEYDLTKYFYIVKDGGSCYFNVYYDYKTQKFFNLWVNGEA